MKYLPMPAPKQQHKWSNPTPTGMSATCERCGATKYHQITNHVKTYTAPGSTLRVHQCPPCKPLTTTTP